MEKLPVVSNSALAISLDCCLDRVELVFLVLSPEANDIEYLVIDVEGRDCAIKLVAEIEVVSKSGRKQQRSSKEQKVNSHATNDPNTVIYKKKDNTSAP